MNKTKAPFADQLIAADPQIAEPPSKYRDAVHAALERTLTPRQRGVYLLLAALLLLASLFFFLVLLRAKPDHAEFLRFIVTYATITAIVLVVLAGGLFRTYWSGVVKQRSSSRWAARIGLGYAATVGLMLLGAVRQTPEMLREEVRAMGWLLLLYAAAAWVRNRVTEAEMNTAEKLLEIELRLAEISHHSGPSQPDN